MTGLGIPGRKGGVPKDFTEEKYYAYPEDELWERVNRTEKDMHDMMTYLNSVENVMGGDDLAEIKRMLSYTSASVAHHTDAYTGIKSQVEVMNKEASSALGRISKHNDEVMQMLADSEQNSRRLQS